MAVWCLLLALAPLLACAGEELRASSDICSRKDSRDAAAIIDSAITPRLQSKGFVLPPACPLNASHSLFKRQEAHKKLVRKGVWQCEFDKKIFRSEAFIDKHMDNKHDREVDLDATECLGTLCEPLQCSFFEAFHGGALSTLAHKPCHPPTMERIKLHCQDLAHQCFPLHMGSAAQELHAFFVSSFCAASQCNWRKREKLLLPLADDNYGHYILWMLLVWAVSIILVLAYALLFCHWSSRVPSAKNSLTQALGSRKWKADKMY